ncbi:MAG UNVERIFIED_CONTAM: hypothetical protein LVR18_26130 [Planctomycetaceae bacterium]
MTVRQLILEQTACPLCGSSSSVYWLSGRDNLCGIPGEFHVVRCRDCQHFYMNPRPVTESLADCYPPDYSPHVPTAQNATDPSPVPHHDHGICGGSRCVTFPGSNAFTTGCWTTAVSPCRQPRNIGQLLTGLPTPL